MNDVGLGQLVPNGGVRVFIANRPPLPIYESLNQLEPMMTGDISLIGQETGNHWRKIFNVYAKLLHGLLISREALPSDISSWQQFRDHHLLQGSSQTALLFSTPALSNVNKPPSKPNIKTNINIIMGKNYAAQLGYERVEGSELIVLDRDFAICPIRNVIVCPYFDYRQLSNIKILKLIDLINQMWS